MAFAIATLVENTVQRLDLIAEHGLSLLIQTSTGEILFDTGQGLALIANATQMHVDLSKLSGIVLSHGHSDHSGGLLQVLGKTGAKPVFAHPAAFSRRYSKRSGELRSIGIPSNAEALEQAGMQLRACLRPMEVLPGILATGPVPRVTNFEKVSPYLLTDGQAGSDLVQDPLEDDQALIIDHGDAPVVVLGCGHSGIVNTLLYASELTGKRRFSLVIGGTHLVDADEAGLQETMKSLQQFEIMKIAPCHCTGLRAQFALREKFGSAFVANATGDRIECGE